MKKRICFFLAFVLTLMTCTVLLSGCGYKKDSQGLLYELSEDKSYYTVHCDGDCDHTEIVIPAEFEGLPVKAIHYAGFSNCENLTKVTFEENSPMTVLGAYMYEDGVTIVRGGDFSHCEKLKEVILPKGLLVVGSGAFDHCSQLSRIELPEGLQVIGPFAFSECSILSEITIPQSVNRIEDGAFHRCYGLISITISKNVTHFGSNLFLDCEKLVEIYNLSSVELTDELSGVRTTVHTSKDEPSVLKKENGFIFCEKADSPKYLMGYEGEDTKAVLPEGEYKIYDHAFINRADLTEIVIPDTVYDIASSAFTNCTGLMETENGITYVGKWAIKGEEDLAQISLRSDTVGIGTHAFSHCLSANVEIPASVMYIGSSAFMKAENLKTVTFAEGSQLKVIGTSAFWLCSAVEAITIPKNVTQIKSGAFFGCDAMTKATFETPYGWQAKTGSVLDRDWHEVMLMSQMTNAEYLTKTYTGEWERH